MITMDELGQKSTEKPQRNSSIDNYEDDELLFDIDDLLLEEDACLNLNDDDNNNNNDNKYNLFTTILSSLSPLPDIEAVNTRCSSSSTPDDIVSNSNAISNSSKNEIASTAKEDDQGNSKKEFAARTSSSSSSSTTLTLVRNISNSAKIKRNKRPKNLPKRPLTAYNIFFKEERIKYRANNPGKLKFAELGKKVGKCWKVVSQAKKCELQQKSDHDRERYEKEMIQYRKEKRQREDREDNEQNNRMVESIAVAAAAAAAASTTNTTTTARSGLPWYPIPPPCRNYSPSLLPQQQQHHGTSISYKDDAPALNRHPSSISWSSSSDSEEYDYDSDNDNDEGNMIVHLPLASSSAARQSPLVAASARTACMHQHQQYGVAAPTLSSTTSSEQACLSQLQHQQYMQEHYLHQQHLQQQQQYPQVLLPSFQQQINHHHAALALNSSSLLYKHSSSSSSILPPLLRPNNAYPHSQASMRPSMHYHLSQQQQQQQQLQQVAVGNCNSFPLLPPVIKVNLPAAAEHERIDTNTSTTCNYSVRYETKTMTKEELEQFKRVTSRIINLYGTLSNDP